MKNPYTKMLFGKYRGHDIAFINSGYLEWLLEQDWFLGKPKNELLICAIEEELKERDFSKSHFWEDKIST